MVGYKKLQTEYMINWQNSTDCCQVFTTGSCNMASIRIHHKGKTLHNVL